MGKKKRKSNHGEADYSARITAILGLLLAIVAIIVPVWQDHINEQERMNIWMRPNPDGIVLLPDDRNNSNVVQVPWLFTLSNTGKVKLSITGYDVFQIENGGLSKFSHLVGLVTYADDSQVVPPITLDAGESTTIKMHLGFRAQNDVLDKLYKLLKEDGAFTLNESLYSLARDGLTIYGGEASYKEIDGSTLVTSEFYKTEPVYRVEFITGRNESFFIQGSETISKIGS